MEATPDKKNSCRLGGIVHIVHHKVEDVKERIQKLYAG
ncbi:unnamed protein product [uncultured virus]|nr:unnamed protein product [uncultured virus]